MGPREPLWRIQQDLRTEEDYRGHLIQLAQKEPHCQGWAWKTGLPPHAQCHPWMPAASHDERNEEGHQNTHCSPKGTSSVGRVGQHSEASRAQIWTLRSDIFSKAGASLGPPFSASEKGQDPMTVNRPCRGQEPPRPSGLAGGGASGEPCPTLLVHIRGSH